VGLAHTGHSQQGDAFVLPGAELVNGEFHRAVSRIKTKGKFNRNAILRQRRIALK
jgi:hypothetical protein